MSIHLHTAILLLMTAACTQELASQTAARPIPAIAGCYRFVRGTWSKPLGVNAAYHALPDTIRLDTVAAGRVGWRVNPDIAVPTNGGFPGTTYWTVQGDTIAVVWSNGFQATRLQLVLESGDLGGYAEVDGDAHEYGRELPRVAIVARRVSCMGVK